MSSSSIILIVFVAAASFALAVSILIYDCFIRYRIRVRERVSELALDGKRDRASVSLFKDIKRFDAQDLGISRHERIQHYVEQSGVELTLSTLAALGIGCGILLGLIGGWFTWWIGVILAPLGVALPGFVVAVRRRRRLHKLCRQLPEAFSMISRAVKSGQTVPAALRIIAEDFEPPISTEFALCYEQQNLGISRESALRKLAARSDIMELQIFVVALLVQAKSGGNLVELLDNLSAMIRKRLNLRERVRTRTGEGRIQAIVLILLPIAVLIGIICTAPEYSQELLNRPWLLAVTATAQAVGALWIHRITNIQY